jgi:hypothetical protein
MLSEESEVIVLNRPILEQLDQVILDTTLPTWLTRPPLNVGSAKLGKLKADVWRTLGTVHLVIMLIRLWSGQDATQRQKEYLENFLALATAIRWATARHTSEYHIKNFEEQIQKYFATLLKIFAKDKLVPNHHASLHLGEFMRSLGPVHGWWTFLFERFNGIIQRQNTNNQASVYYLLASCKKNINLSMYLGAMEITFTCTFCQGANLRALMASSRTPVPLKALRPAFDKTFGNDFSITLLQDLLAKDPAAAATDRPAEWSHDHASVNLSQETHDTFHHYLEMQFGGGNSEGVQITVQLRKKIVLHGASFCPVKHSHKNSQVIFIDPITQTQRAGEINEIFIYRWLDGKKCWVADTFLSVRPFKQLLPHEAQHDPYHHYPLLDVRIYRKSKEPITIISWHNIISHAATCPISWPEIGNDLIVVQSLDRVGLIHCSEIQGLNFFIES